MVASTLLPLPTLATTRSSRLWWDLVEVAAALMMPWVIAANISGGE